MLVLATVEPASPAVAEARPVSLVVDTDLGNDDVLALVFLTGAATWPFRAVTVSGTGLARRGDGLRLPGFWGARRVPTCPSPAGEGGIPLAGFNGFPVE